MASVLSPINLIVLLAILFVAVDCDHHEGEKYDLSKGHHFGSGRDQPNFFEKISHHIIKGWHGLRGLFGRKSKLREEGYGHGGGGRGAGVYGQEEVHKPFEKEVTVNKEFPEPEANKEYPSFSNHRPGAYKVKEEKHIHGHKELGHKELGHKEEKELQPEGHQGYQGGVDENFKGDGKKEEKEEKNFGYEESVVKPFDQRNGDKKNRGFEKRSADESEMNNSENDNRQGGSYEGSNEGPDESGSNEERSSDGDESDSGEHDETRRFKRAAKGGGRFGARPHFRGLHGRPFRRP